MDWENKFRLKINAAESIMYLIVPSCLMYLQVSEKLFDYMGFVHSLIFFYKLKLKLFYCEIKSGASRVLDERSWFNIYFFWDIWPFYP